MSIDNSWYLLMAMVSPDQQGRGHLSRIWREAHEKYPNEMFTLEATTLKSRLQYERFGFEVRPAQAQFGWGC